MIHVLEQVLPILVIAGFAGLFTVAALRGARHDRALRDIRTSLDETERMLEELGRRKRGAPHDEERR